MAGTSDMPRLAVTKSRAVVRHGVGWVKKKLSGFRRGKKSDKVEMTEKAERAEKMDKTDKARGVSIVSPTQLFVG